MESETPVRPPGLDTPKGHIYTELHGWGMSGIVSLFRAERRLAWSMPGARGSVHDSPRRRRNSGRIFAGSCSAAGGYS